MTPDGEQIEGFIFNETEATFEVLLSDSERFEVVFFCKDSHTSLCGHFQLIDEEL
jgi:K+/H+ antiporter YhaU regulatory subunit KhtT